MLKIKFFLKNYLEKFPRLIHFFLRNLNFFYIFLPFEKDYKALEIIFSEKTSKSGDIIDVGANHGQSSLSFRKLGFKNNNIYLFEPNSSLIKYIEKIKDSKFHIFNYGLGHKKENVYLYKPVLNNTIIDSLSSNNLNLLKKQIKIQFPNKEKYISYVKEKIKLLPFDTLKLKIKPIIIKIDVEGNEFNVIKGMFMTIKKFLPIIILEYNNSNFFKINKLLGNYYNTYFYSLDLNKLLKFNLQNTKVFFYEDFYDYKKPRNIIFYKK
jgi:FkbM family methyltransferase